MTVRPLPRLTARLVAWAAAGGALALGIAAVWIAVARPATAGAATPACQTSGLVIWMNTQGNGTAGTIFYTLNFTNLSGHACTLRGYPGVSAIGLHGQRVGRAASRLSLHPVKTITIGNGRTAHATLGIVDTGALPHCHMTTAAGLRVFPPNQRASRTIPFPFAACGGTGPSFLRIATVVR